MDDLSDNSNMSEPNEDASALPQNNDSDEETLIPSEIVNEIELFTRLIEQHLTDLAKPVSEDSETAQQISTELPKSNELETNLSQENVPALTQPTYSNLQVLILNEATRQINLFWRFLAKQNLDFSQSGISNSRNLSVVSNKSHERCKSSEAEKESKSELRKRSKSSKLRRKSKTPKSPKETKSCKETKTPEAIMLELVTSLKDMKLPETNVTYEAFVGEGATASSKTGNKRSSDAKNEIEYYFSLFKEEQITSSPTESSDSDTLTPGSDEYESRSNPFPSTSFDNSNMTTPFANSMFSEVSVSSTLSESSEKSELSQQSQSEVILTPTRLNMRSKEHNPSVRSKQFDPSVRPKQLDPSVRPKQLDPSVRPKQLDPSVRPKQLDPSVRPKQLNPSVRPKQLNPSVKPKHRDPSVRPKHRDPSVRLKQLDPAMRPKQLDPSVRPKCFKQSGSKLAEPSKDSRSADESAVGLTQNRELKSQLLMKKLRLEQFILSRRHYILRLRDIAERVKDFMEIIAILKQGHPDPEKDKQEAGDWVKVLNYWDIVIEGIKIMIENINEIYEVLYDSKILPTSKQFDDFIRHIVCVFRDVLELDKACHIGLPECSRFCSNLDLVKFQNYATTFMAHVMLLLEKLRVEVKQFHKFKKNK